MYKKILILIVSVLCGTSLAFAKTCPSVTIKDAKIIQIKSAINMGTRIQLPSALVGKPVISNPDLWDVDGLVNHIVVKPNSPVSQGEKAMLFAFMEDGTTVDIELTRVDKNNNQPCVILKTDDANQSVENGLKGMYSKNVQYSTNEAAQSMLLQRQIVNMQQSFNTEKKNAVSEALRTYRYYIYTRLEPGN